MLLEYDFIYSYTNQLYLTSAFIISKVLSHYYNYIACFRAGNIASSVVEHLPRIHKALGSKPSTEKIVCFSPNSEKSDSRKK
jgi:hypothetical protein